MLTRFGLSIAIVLGSAATITPAAAVTLDTGTGLTVTFSDSDGSVVAVAVDGRSVPLVPGAPGGVAVELGSRMPQSQVVLLDFDIDGGLWAAAHNANWDDAGSYVTWQPVGGTGGTGHLLLGNGVTTGVGMAMAAPVPVPGGSTVRISWLAQSASTETTQILCVRLFDASGSDITASLTPPSGWGWTSTSQAHAVWGLNFAQPTAWECFEQRYTVPPEAASIRVSLRHWTGGDHLVHVDDLAIDVVGGIQWSGRIPVLGPVSPIPGGLRQTVDLAGYDLRVTADTIAESGRIRIDLQAQDLSAGSEDRPMLLHWTLPVAAQGWSWWDDIDTARVIDSATVLANTFHLAGHPVSLYPFSTLTGMEIGLALAVPMDQPIAQRFEYHPVNGLQSTWELALSPLTVKLGPGHAAVSLVLFEHDPAWGFRAAAQEYYGQFPDYFVKRTTLEGAWMYPVPPSQIPDPDDFGFAYFETHPLDPAERNVCAQYDIGIFHYSEPWLSWQCWGNTPDKPPYEERVALLEAWAFSPEGFATWLPNGGVGNSGHLRLGDGVTTGAGMATTTSFAVLGDDILDISWQGRVASTDTTQILCLRLFDSGGNDITETTPAPAGWFWSTASQAHVVAGIANAMTEEWESFSYSYPLPLTTTAVRLSLRHWNGGDHLTDLDDLEVIGINTSNTYLVMRFEGEDGSWVSAHNADWEDSGATWLRALRQQAAQAVINSSPLDAEGRYLIDLSGYFWHEWAPNSWNQAWPVGPDPDHVSPNAYDLYRDFWILHRLDEVDGVYIDSVTATGGVGGWENHRPQHLAVSDTPLTFSWLDGSATQLAPQAHAEFLGPIAAEVRSQGRLMMLNLFPEATRFHAHDGDVMGSEVSQLVEADARSRVRRTLARHRIVSNLLQWGWDSPTYITYEQMEEFIRGQLFWGFYPAVSSAGGLLNGGTPDRYFLHPELYERDRPLFQHYMPVIRMLSTAGWEPVTHAATTPVADIERYGDFSRGPIRLSVRGAASSAFQGDVTVDLTACGLPAGIPDVQSSDVLADLPLQVVLLADPMRARISVTLNAGEVGIYEFTATVSLPGDFDQDGDLDLDDLAAMVFCLQGPVVPYPNGHYCLTGDSDLDSDVDLRDLATFQEATVK